MRSCSNFRDAGWDANGFRPGAVCQPPTQHCETAVPDNASRLGAENLPVKLAVSAGIVISAAIALLTLAKAQNLNSELKHVIVPLNSTRWVSLAAVNIERGVEYPSVVSLKGNVEMKVPVCVSDGTEFGRICDGQMIVRADEAQVHEDTGEIEAHGTVVITHGKL